MLVNNFKGLIQFGNTFTFKNVAGEENNAFSLLGHNGLGTAYNNHTTMGQTSFNYDFTTASDNFTVEQEKYTWANVVTGTYSSSGYNNKGECGLTLFCGSGLKEVTSEDYKLDNALNLATAGAFCQHKGNITAVIRVFQNNTEKNVTINEIGLYVFKTATLTNGDDNHYLVMIARKLLEAPITLAPNETTALTYQFKFEDFKFTEE